jgi:hypothetical protein
MAFGACVWLGLQRHNYPFSKDITKGRTPQSHTCHSPLTSAEFAYSGGHDARNPRLLIHAELFSEQANELGRCQYQ